MRLFNNIKKYFINKESKYKNIIKKIFILLFIIFLGLYVIAFFMKDFANHTNVKKLCQEYVNGPRNVVALMVNKIFPETMTYKTNIIFQQDKKDISIADKMLMDIVSRINKQKEVDNQLNKELESGTYTFDDPLIVQDPYDMAPLTALVLYTSEKPELVSIKIVGKTEKSDIEYTFTKQGYTTKHIIPIMGLYANNDNTVILTSVDEQGNKKEKQINIQTEDLKNDLQNINLTVFKGNVDNYQKGLNFSYASVNQESIKMAFDINGDIRWYFTNPLMLVNNFNEGKSIFVICGNDWYGDTIICEMNYLGKILNMYYYPAGVHHDLYLTNHNTMLVTGNHQETFEDLVSEINLNDGKVVSNIDYRKLFPRTRVPVALYNKNFPQDWTHMNSVVEYDGDVVISSNFQSTIMRNSKDGKIKWMLADPRDFTTYWQQYLLKPIGEDFEYPYNQHAVEVLPDYDHNPDTVDILLFDNGSSRFLADEELQKNIRLGKEVEPKLYSRLVHYRINEKDMTVEQIWQYGKERPELFSPTRGDADLLANGNILGVFNQEKGVYASMLKQENPDIIMQDTVYVEVNQNKDVIWECYASSNKTNNIYLDYRLERLPIYNDDNDYMDIEKEMNNFVPMEVLKKYGYQN